MTRKEELAIKLDRIRKLMEKLELDGVYLKRQDDFAWLSCGGQNYLGWGEMGLCGLLVTANDTHAVTNIIEKPRMIDEERLEEMGFKVHSSVWHVLDFEAKKLKELVPSGKLGLDFNSPLGRNIEGDIKTLRLSLTTAEVERVKEVGVLATLAMEEAAASLRPGVSEIEATKRIAMALYDQGMEFTSLMCAADERLYNYRHAIATDNRMRERVQIGGNMRKWGLTVCLTRYVNFVPVTEEIRAQYRLNQLIDCTLMEKTVVGRPYNEPLLAAKALYEANGFADEFDKHHLGGPIGYANRDYRVDPTMTIEVVENQTFCWNPSITGTKSEDTILVTSKGFEFITRPMLFPSNEVVVNGNTYVRPDILEKY
ncbi:MAG: M24 family metallopeptidase [Sphaerochaeta sp.]